MCKRVLIVEDDAALARLMRDNLVYDKFVVDWAANGSEVLAKVEAFAPDLVLLDVMLPGNDGFTLCRQLRRQSDRMSIIIVTVRGEKNDKVHGLELGADDYVTKPFALEELLARVHAVLRRSQPRINRITLGDVLVDFHSHRATRSGRELAFSHLEFEVLRCLAEHSAGVVTRDELLEVVWGYREAPLTRTVDNLIARLRRKIEPDPHQPRFIHTAHGGGYSLVVEDLRAES